MLSKLFKFYRKLNEITYNWAYRRRDLIKTIGKDIGQFLQLSIDLFGILFLFFMIYVAVIINKLPITPLSYTLVYLCIINILIKEIARYIDNFKDFFKGIKFYVGYKIPNKK